ncbi:SusD/RagB family nutrient-binding outer membrane lipoprotein [Dinghuibacter silviterrae]|uniref:SusD-like starch-binding protein associating with outer membrane n=1 Tax=Dinghuibacter silviterrae TaxID=1539049 RepID=A0A4R8DWZ1_9BACT|nr:SusD/RagB family nutrient-binding outer membrane lipoprotein [Dinghuibacter silviterrae]TDX01957.1 SusD-like starch-binding protein associating with outer membrane [Dinghuibacter silviterrae]
MKRWIIGVALLATACTKNLSSLNNNSKNPQEVPSGSLFLNGEKNLSDALSSTDPGVGPFRILAQTWTENTYTSEARYILTADNSPQGWWNALYANGTGGVLDNLVAAAKAFPNDVTDAGTLRNDEDITDILQVYAWSILVNTYGNVPYTKAFTDSIPFPAYDDAKTIYKDLLTRLDTAINGLNTSNGSLGASDQVYQGDPAHWKKFGATLELKLALVIADADPQDAQTYTQKALSNGVFASNADNALLAYEASPTTNANPVYQALVISGRHDYSPCDLIVDTMVAWSDPRLPLYFTTINGVYAGGVPGAGNGYVKFSQFSSQWLQPTFPGTLLDYAESEFLQAEAVARNLATGSAATHYANAVTAAIESWGGSAGDAAEYLLQPAVAYNAATWKQQIGFQQWIAYANRGWDAWTSIRRLGYPNIDAVNPPVGAQGNLPRRFTYPGNEESSNPIHWAEAVQAVNGSATDNVATKLWWNQ